MAESPLKILMVASEGIPFAKTGGLADVVGSLPPALADLGHRIRLVMPWYRQAHDYCGSVRARRCKLAVPMGGRVYLVNSRSVTHRGVSVDFIDWPEFYDRPELYGEEGRDYADNGERFALLSRAALELCRQRNWRPDVVHAHDWQTGLVPIFLHNNLWRDPFFKTTGSLFSIHNLGYQGLFPLTVGPLLALDADMLTADGLEYHGQVSFLKGGIRFANQVNTVSPTYCQEIQTPQQGMGMDGLLRARSDRLHGILNGLDGTLWSPERDQALPERYTATDLSGKRTCKAHLQNELALDRSPLTPIVAMITRLDAQKGIELVLESWDRILQHDLQLVILGTGSPDFEKRLAAAARFYPGRARVLLRFDDALSRRIYAGSDLFLMPSRYEPCGLGQLIALRYGSVPVVHATGGLKDTIVDPRQAPQAANGFVFDEYRHHSLLACLERALSHYAREEAWAQLIRPGMQEDTSWQNAAQDYVTLYRNCTRTPS
ncbi:MAG: glycogen synthase GlgA [Desulfuromonadales bacterium]